MVAAVAAAPPSRAASSPGSIDATISSAMASQGANGRGSPSIHVDQSTCIPAVRAGARELLDGHRVLLTDAGLSDDERERRFACSCVGEKRLEGS